LSKGAQQKECGENGTQSCFMTILKGVDQGG
jgi:hypothetical protein